MADISGPTLSSRLRTDYINVRLGSDDSGCYDTVFWYDDVQIVHVLQQSFTENP